MGALYFNGQEATSTLFNRTMVVGTDAVPASGSHTWYGRIRYNGSTWEVSTSNGSAGVATAMLSWDATDDELDIDFTTSIHFASAPIIVGTPLNLDSAYNVKTSVSESSGEFTGHIAFFNISTGARITTESTDMDVNVIITGPYV